MDNLSIPLPLSLLRVDESRSHPVLCGVGKVTKKGIRMTVSEQVSPPSLKDRRLSTLQSYSGVQSQVGISADRQGPRLPFAYLSPPAPSPDLRSEAGRCPVSPLYRSLERGLPPAEGVPASKLHRSPHRTDSPEKRKTSQ